MSRKTQLTVMEMNSANKGNMRSTGTTC